MLLLLIAGGAIFAFFTAWAATFDLDKIGQMPQLAEVLDLDGNPYSRLRGENRIVVSLDKVSPYFINALVAREDTRFYKHHGVDPRGIARAVFRNLTRGRVAEGASTLTQQLARNSLPLGGRTLRRKVLEAFVATRIERKFSKDQILEFYINRIYYGSGLYGLETASEAYFGKPCEKLTLSEAALMAGLIRSPGRFSPLKNPDGARHERDTVLERMVGLGMITSAQADTARRENVRVTRLRSLGFQDNYAIDAINRELHDLLDDDQLADGNLKIYTTIDPALQKLATDAIEAQLEKIEARSGYEHQKKRDYHAGPNAGAPDYLQGALVLIDNRTGGVRALVGGRDFKESNFNRAISARRQIGSSFKPFVYAAAFNKGLLPGASIDDGPIQPGELRDANLQPVNWNPSNSDGQFIGVQPADVGLIRSRNTMSIRVGAMADFDRDDQNNIRRYTGAVPKLGAAVGLGDAIPPQPTSYLGAFESDLRTLTEAYSIFPNWGTRRPAYLIERVDDVSGNILYQMPQDKAKSVLKPAVAWMVSAVLEKVMKNGTAAEARSLGWTRPAAGKTGTTNDFKDAWFLGYTTSLTCGVWVGLDQPETIVKKGYGAALALPIWCQVVGKADPKRYPAENFKPPETLQRVTLCSYSNEQANAGCVAASRAYSAELPVSMIPQRHCFFHGGDAEAPGEQIPGGFQGQPTPPPNPNERRPGDPLPSRFLRSFRKFFGGG